MRYSYVEFAAHELIFIRFLLSALILMVHVLLAMRCDTSLPNYSFRGLLFLIQHGLNIIARCVFDSTGKKNMHKLPRKKRRRREAMRELEEDREQGALYSSTACCLALYCGLIYRLVYVVGSQL